MFNRKPKQYEMNLSNVVARIKDSSDDLYNVALAVQEQIKADNEMIERMTQRVEDNRFKLLEVQDLRTALDEAISNLVVAA